mgnify:CR=1 FL=1
MYTPNSNWIGGFRDIFLPSSALERHGSMIFGFQKREDHLTNGFKIVINDASYSSFKLASGSGDDCGEGDITCDRKRCWIMCAHNE